MLSSDFQNLLFFSQVLVEYLPLHLSLSFQIFAQNKSFCGPKTTKKLKFFEDL